MRERKEKEEIEWDKKKIIVTAIAIILLLGIIFQFKSLFINETKIANTNTSKQQAKGVSIQQASEGLRQNLTNSIESLRQEAQKLDIAEVATSSPQVQKILNDLRSLKDLPKNQLKDACEKVCGGL